MTFASPPLMALGLKPASATYAQRAQVMVGVTIEPILRERTDVDDYRRFLQALAELIVRLAADGSRATLKVAAPYFVTKAAKRPQTILPLCETTA